MNHIFLKSPQGESPIIVEAEFNASVTRLFQAWTNSEGIKKWFGSEELGPDTATIDLRVGGEWKFVFAEDDGVIDSLTGKYVAVEQDKLLTFT